MTRRPRDPNKIYLSAVRDGDRFKLIDQDGRELALVRAIRVETALDDATVLTVELYDSALTGGSGPHCNENAS